MSRLLDETIATVRRITSRLRPTVLDDLGLTAGLDWLVRQVFCRSGLQINLATALDGIVLDPECALSIYRITQEALTNVVRHAKANLVDVSLTRVGDDLVLRVADNGRGFESASNAGLGLVGIRERARRWDGKVEISGSPDSGTVVGVTIPLDRASTSPV